MEDLTDQLTSGNNGKPISLRNVAIKLSFKELKLLTLLLETPPESIASNATLFADYEYLYEQVNDLLTMHYARFAREEERKKLADRILDSDKQCG